MYIKRSYRVVLIKDGFLNVSEDGLWSPDTMPCNRPPTISFSGVRVTRCLVFYVCFVDRCFSFCIFSFGHCVVCSSSIYGFSDYLPLVSSNSSSNKALVYVKLSQKKIPIYIKSLWIVVSLIHFKQLPHSPFRTILSSTTCVLQSPSIK